MGTGDWRATKPEEAAGALASGIASALAAASRAQAAAAAASEPASRVSQRRSAKKWRRVTAASLLLASAALLALGLVWGFHPAPSAPTPPTPAPESGSWIAGGDLGISWVASASSQFLYCQRYDFCDYQHMVDGTSAGAGTLGLTFALNGPKRATYPQWLQIDFGVNLTISRWRLAASNGNIYAAKDATLEVRNTTVIGSIIHDTRSASGSGLCASEQFEPVMASVVRIAIAGEWPAGGGDSSTQVYIREVQFFVAHVPPPTPRPGTLFCGKSYADATTRCHAPCDGTSTSCAAFAGENCWANCISCAPTPPPTPAPPGCTGASENLPQSQCGAWIDFYTSTSGEAWSHCSGQQTDPCACQGSDGKSPVCTANGTAVITM
jgi:hypothetical protein